MNYRQKIYQNYISQFFGKSHQLNQAEYDLSVRVNRKRFGRLLPADKNIRILEVGCGAGQFLYFLNKSGYQNTICIDISDEQIAQCQKMTTTQVIKTDMWEYLKNNPPKFDLIVSFDVIEHLTKNEIIDWLELLSRNLNPGGQVLIGTLNATSGYGAYLRYIDFTHEISFTRESLEEVLTISNFHDIKVYGEEPVNHDLKGLLRNILWQIRKLQLKLYWAIDMGTGRGIWTSQPIFSARMFAIAKK